MNRTVKEWKQNASTVYPGSEFAQIVADLAEMEARALAAEAECARVTQRLQFMKRIIREAADLSSHTDSPLRVKPTRIRMSGGGL